MSLHSNPPAAPAAPFTFTTSAGLLARSQAALSMGVSSGMRRAGGPLAIDAAMQRV